MRIGEVLRSNQPGTYSDLNKQKKKRKKKKPKEEKLTEFDIKQLMKHDSHKRVNGAIRQVR